LDSGNRVQEPAFRNQDSGNRVQGARFGVRDPEISIELILRTSGLDEKVVQKELHPYPD